MHGLDRAVAENAKSIPVTPLFVIVRIQQYYLIFVMTSADGPRNRNNRQ